MYRLVLIATGCLLCFNNPSFGQVIPLSGGRAVVHKALGSHDTVDVTLKTRAMRATYSYPGAVLWGGAGGKPKFFISAILLKYDGQKISLPLSSYGDLGDPDTVEVTATKVGFDVSIVGSDAAGSYRATLVFQTIGGNMLLQSRMVRSGEFPEQGWEKTVYSYVTETN